MENQKVIRYCQIHRIVIIKEYSYRVYKSSHFFYCCSSTIVSIFTPPRPPPAPPIPASHPWTYPLWLCPCVLYTCSLMTLPLLSLSSLFSGNCQFVLYFSVSGCILLACLFCWLGSMYRWDEGECICSFARYWQTPLHRSCTVSCPHQQWMSVLIFSQPPEQHVFELWAICQHNGRNGISVEF